MFVSIPVYTIGDATGKIDQHAGITVQENVVDGRDKGIQYFAQNNTVVLLLLHTDNQNNGAKRTDDLGQQGIIGHFSSHPCYVLALLYRCAPLKARCAMKM